MDNAWPVAGMHDGPTVPFKLPLRSLAIGLLFEGTLGALRGSHASIGSAVDAVAALDDGFEWGSVGASMGATIDTH